MRRASLRSSVGVESLVRVADEGQARGVFIVARLGSLGPVRSASVVLVDLVDREVSRINVRVQLGLEWRADPSQRIPVNATEERMLLDLASPTNTAEAVFGIADQAREGLLDTSHDETAHRGNSPPDKIFSLCAQLLVRREVEVSRPVDNLAVRVVRLFSTERWPADKALEHDGADGPPIAAEVVSLPAEYLWRYVVGSTHGRVS